jgi:hypothetical protein
MTTFAATGLPFVGTKPVLGVATRSIACEAKTSGCDAN